MARVEWTRMAPDDIEQVLAVLVCREFPSAIRVRPSQRAGGGHGHDAAHGGRHQRPAMMAGDPLYAPR